MTSIYVDADACPVREEMYRVASRLRVPVHVVSNGSRPIRAPDLPNVQMVLVPSGADAADDWTAERIRADRNALVYIDTDTMIRPQDRRPQTTVFAWDCSKRTLQFPLMRISRAFRYIGPAWETVAQLARAGSALAERLASIARLKRGARYSERDYWQRVADSASPALERAEAQNQLLNRGRRQ
jgi:Uncharacterized BCR, YaiI/YqxD family COG1671